MAQVISFENYRPSPRYDDIPWTEALIYEAATADADDADWTLIDTLTLSPVDADPAEPAARDLTTELASDTDELWYRIIFADASGDTLQPTAPVQNVAGPTAYATVTELARILKIRTPSTEQTEAMERVLLTAAGEIDAEIDLADDAGLSGWQVALATQVNLDRAADLWHHTESKTGLSGMLGDLEGVPIEGRYSWNRYAHRLAPIKGQWGLAALAVIVGLL